jgi:hypothetical protein
MGMHVWDVIVLTKGAYLCWVYDYEIGVGNKAWSCVFVWIHRGERHCIAASPPFFSVLYIPFQGDVEERL